MSEHPRFGTKLDLGAQVQFHALTVDDLREVRSLQQDGFAQLCAQHATEAEAEAFETVVISPRHTEELMRCVAKDRLLGARIDRRLVGAATWADSRENNTTLRLRSLFIDPMFSRCGIGRALLRYVEDKVQASGGQELAVRTFVHTAGFFEQAGYSTTSYGVLALTADEAMAVAFMRKPLLTANDQPRLSSS